MTTHHLLVLCIQQWHYVAAHGWHVPRHCRVTFLRYMWRITRNGSYDRWWLRHVFVPRHIGPRAWKGWLLS